MDRIKVALTVQAVKHATSDVNDPQTVREAAVFGAVVDCVSKAKLSNTSKSLKCTCLYEFKKDMLNVIVCVECNDVMDRITKKFGSNDGLQCVFFFFDYQCFILCFVRLFMCAMREAKIGQITKNLFSDLESC